MGEDNDGKKKQKKKKKSKQKDEDKELPPEPEPEDSALFAVWKEERQLKLQKEVDDKAALEIDRMVQQRVDERLAQYRAASAEDEGIPFINPLGKR